MLLFNFGFCEPPKILLQVLALITWSIWWAGIWWFVNYVSNFEIDARHVRGIIPCDKKSRGENGFLIWPFLNLTGQLAKIGGLRHIFQLNLYRWDLMFYLFVFVSYANGFMIWPFFDPYWSFGENRGSLSYFWIEPVQET